MCDHHSLSHQFAAKQVQEGLACVECKTDINWAPFHLKVSCLQRSWMYIQHVKMNISVENRDGDIGALRKEHHWSSG